MACFTLILPLPGPDIRKAKQALLGLPNISQPHEICGSGDFLCAVILGGVFLPRIHPVSLKKSLLFICYLFIVFEQKRNGCLLVFPLAGATFAPKKGSSVQTPKCSSTACSLDTCRGPVRCHEDPYTDIHRHASMKTSKGSDCNKWLFKA